MKNDNLQKLKTEIKSLSKSIQIIYEIDGFLWKTNEILNSFTNSDWEKLNKDLINWNNKELEVLAKSLISADDGMEVVDDNYTFGYIFTLVDNQLASTLLTNDLGDFLLDNKVKSVELFEMMKNKIMQLFHSEYLNQTEMNSWLEFMDNAERKISI